MSAKRDKENESGQTQEKSLKTYYKEFRKVMNLLDLKFSCIRIALILSNVSFFLGLFLSCGKIVQINSFESWLYCESSVNLQVFRNNHYAFKNLKDAFDSSSHQIVGNDLSEYNSKY